MKRNGYVRILLSILFALLLSNTIPIMASADEIIVTEEVSFDEGDSDTLEEVWVGMQEENQAGEELPEESQANEELQEESQTDEELQEDTQVDEELQEESQAGEELQGESQDAANPLTGDVSFDALIEPEIVITYDGNGGTYIAADGSEAPTKSVKYAKGFVEDGLFWPTSPTGKRFIGYSSTRDGSDLLTYDKTIGGYFIATESRTYYAVWEAGARITFNANGGLFSNNNQEIIIEEYEVNTRLHSYPDVKEREGYAFVGWSTTPGGAALPFDSDGFFTAKEDTTLYAVWKKAYKIIFDANGGTFYKGTVTTTNYYADAGEILRGYVEPDGRDGYVFAGWSTDRSGSPLLEYDEALGGYYKATGDATLYAVWKKGCKITFDANGGTFYKGTETTTVFNATPGEMLQGNVEPDERDGYAFAGWSTNRSGNPLLDYDKKLGGYYKVTGDATLYAVWKKACKVTFNANGGVFNDGTKTKTQSMEKNSVLSSYPYPEERANQLFMGWNTKKNATTGLEYDRNIDGYLRVTDDITLYAVWSSYYEILFDANGGTFSKGRETTTYFNAEPGEILQGFVEPDERDGYVLIGWSTNQSGSPLLEYDKTLGGYYKATGNATLYAVWKKACTITFKANGGSFVGGGTTAQLKVEINKGLSIWPPDDGSDGKLLKGWSLDSSGKQFLEAGENGVYYTPTGDATLYAVWYKAITFDANGGTFRNGKTKKDYMYADVGDVFRGDMEPDDRKGYILDGWSTKRTGKSLKYNDSLGGYFKVTGDITLYAVWKEACTISFNANGGRFMDGSKTKELKLKKNVYLNYYPALAKDGKKAFIGWNYKPTDKKALEYNMDQDGFLKVTKNVTLYAIWSDVKVTLNKTKASVNIGNSVNLVASVTPNEAGQGVTWKSSNTKVATVTAKGVVKGLKKGKATITAAAKNGSGASAVCTVSVLQPVTKIKLNKTSGTVKAGKSITLKVTVTPDAASNKAVVWKSSNTKVATVTQKGVVKGVKAGTAKITVTAKDGSGKKATCKITVK